VRDWGLFVFKVVALDRGGPSLNLDRLERLIVIRICLNIGLRLELVCKEETVSLAVHFGDCWGRPPDAIHLHV